MAQMTPKVAEVLDKAMELSSHERSLLIDRLVRVWMMRLPMRASTRLGLTSTR